MRMRNLFLVIVMAGLTFGGTFNCNDDDDDDDAFVGDSGTTGSGASTGSTGSGFSSGSGSGLLMLDSGERPDGGR